MAASMPIRHYCLNAVWIYLSLFQVGTFGRFSNWYVATYPGYLDDQVFEKYPSDIVSKPPKPGFVSFVGIRLTGFQNG
jgi:hypothetical protein